MSNSKEIIDLKENKKFLIETWGCQMNEEDSEKLSGMLMNMGYESTLFREKADVIIFNTCAVRENAELKVYGNLGALKQVKRDNPDLTIAVCGCMMQQKGVADEIAKTYNHVDIVFGTHNAHKFPEYLEEHLTTNRQIIEIYNKETEIIEGIPIIRESSIKAFVTIMYGCDNFCTFCIVPYVRGRERSRKVSDIVNEIEVLVKEGYKEITLLGQNVNSYGKDFEDTDVNFAELLRTVNEIKGLQRIRFMTSHPKDLSKELIMAIKECDKVVEQVHLPVQSGSNNMLKKMNRKYTRESYLETVNLIKKEIPSVALSTDIIVGFPGETEEDFEETLSLVREVQYDSAFTFIYSRRKYTPADKMKDQIDEDVKHERFNRLLEIVRRDTENSNKAMQDKVVEVLVEDISKKDDEFMHGRTRNGKSVVFKGDESLVGKLCNVKITKARSFSLEGEILNVK